MSTQPMDVECGAERTGTSARLVGREPERTRISQILKDAAAGRSTALCIHGQSGAGKTSLLEDATGQAGAFRVLRVCGRETERDLPYAGVHQLCAPLMSGIHQLEPGERAALSEAVDQPAGREPDRFLVSMAVLNLLTGVAAEQPVCCIVDDAHLLDDVSLMVLAFVARRAESGALLVLFADGGRQRLIDLDGVTKMHLGPLSWDDSRLVLAARAPYGIDPAVIERVLLEARGNPQALADAFDGHTAAELAGGYAIPPRRPGNRGVDHECAQRARHVSDDARRLLLLTAAEPTGDPTAAWSAAGLLGIGTDAAEALEAADLLTFGPRILFTCPQLRSSVYHGATHAERQAVHRALAGATAGADHADRRAWHRALSTPGADDRVADDLEQSALAAQHRGGVAARAAFLEKATLLSTDAESRAQRALAAATAKLLAGGLDEAQRLLAIATIAPADEPRDAKIVLQRARIGFIMRRDNAAPAQLLDAAQRLQPYWPFLARQAHLEALVSSMAAGRLATRPTLTEAAQTARAAAAEDSTEPVDLLLQALATRTLAGYVAAVSSLQEAVRGFGDCGCASEGWSWLAGFIAADLWDVESWSGLSHGCEEQPSCGQHGAAADFQRPDHALAQIALFELHRGQFDRARATLSEADARSQAGGVAPVLSPSLLLAAWQGNLGALKDRLPMTSQGARRRGDDRGMAAVSLAEAVLYNGLGRYEDAVVSAQHAVESEQLALSAWALPELVESAARSGRRDTAATALAVLRARTAATGTDWGLGVHAASAALLAEGHAAEDLYIESIDRLSRSGMQVHLGRAQLLYGEWLRRKYRRLDARNVLRSATDLFVNVGADAFADRARRELRATSEKARARRVDTARNLTPQESRIAYLARDGLTNPEIGSALFISPRTVEYHLRNAFGKLDITSRTKLHLVLKSTGIRPGGGSASQRRWRRAAPAEADSY